MSVKKGAMLLALGLLAGCQDVPVGLPSYSQAEVSRPAQSDVIRPRARGETPQQSNTETVAAAEGAAQGTAGTDDALPDGLAQSATSEGAQDSVAQAPAPAQDGGVFGLLRGVLGSGAGGQDASEEVALTASALPEEPATGAQDAQVQTARLDQAEVRADGDPGSVTSAEAPEPQERIAPRQAGIFGLFGLGNGGLVERDKANAAAQDAAQENGTEAAVEPVSLAQDADAQAAPVSLARAEPETSDLVEPAKRRGIFGALFSGGTNQAGNAGAPQAAAATSAAISAVKRGAASSREPELAPGAPLAFGTVGRVCKVSRSQRGRQVDKFPKKNRGGGYALYDTDPGATGMRSFYITGFKDGCTRMVTAANVVFGAPSTYERLRYGLPSETLRKSATDAAYKRLKSKVCNVRRNQPCGKSIAKLERDTVFVTLYDTFEGSKTWSNVLLHRGDVYARDVRSAR